MTDNLAANQWSRQLLQRDRPLRVVEVVELAGGIYSTAPTSYLSFAARIPGFERSQLDKALMEDRSLARLATLRGSGFLIPIDKVDVVLAAEDRVSWYQRHADKIAGPKKTELWRERIMDLLGEGPLPARTIRRELDVTGREAEALRYVLSAMTQSRDLAAATQPGGWRSNQYSYALWSQWFPDHPPASVDPEAARAEVARWYLHGHGPGSVDHFAWWSGLKKSNARLALDSVGVVGEAGQYDLPTRPGTAEPSGLRLLPIWDTALVSPKGRRRMVESGHERFVYDSSGNVTSTIVLDGAVVGVWDRGGDDELLVVKAAGFEPLEASFRADIEEEVEILARSVGARDWEVQFVERPIDLTTASRNRFMSPLSEPS